MASSTSNSHAEAYDTLLNSDAEANSTSALVPTYFRPPRSLEELPVETLSMIMRLVFADLWVIPFASIGYVPRHATAPFLVCRSLYKVCKTVFWSAIILSIPDWAIYHHMSFSTFFNIPERSTANLRHLSLSPDILRQAVKWPWLLTHMPCLQSVKICPFRVRSGYAPMVRLHEPVRYLQRQLHNHMIHGFPQAAQWFLSSQWHAYNLGVTCRYLLEWASLLMPRNDFFLHLVQMHLLFDPYRLMNGGAGRYTFDILPSSPCTFLGDSATLRALLAASNSPNKDMQVSLVAEGYQLDSWDLIGHGFAGRFTRVWAAEIDLVHERCIGWDYDESQWQWR